MPAMKGVTPCLLQKAAKQLENETNENLPEGQLLVTVG